MKIYTAKPYHQALILACKGHLRREDENSSVESIKRVICKIIGHDKPEDITDKIVNFWLYQAYEWLLEVEETKLKQRNELKNFLLEEHTCHWHTPSTFGRKVSYFLITEMNLTQIYEENVFKITLDKENEYMVR